MNISKIEAIAVGLPMIKPVIMAGEEVRRADNVLVRLEAGNGLVGWGEAAAAPTMTGETIASMVAAVHHLGPVRVAARRTISAARSPPWTAACMEITAPRPRSRSPCTYPSAARPIGPRMRFGDRRRSRLTILGVIGGGDLDGDLR